MTARHAARPAHRTPPVDVATGAPAPPSSARPRCAPLARRVRVLLVDDDPDVLEVAVSVLGEAGCAVESAPSANAALDRLRHGALPDVIVTDLEMPGLSGWELVRAIRAIPALAALPILLFSVVPLHAPPSPGTSLLLKPCTSDALVDAVVSLARWSDDPTSGVHAHQP